VAAAKPVMLAIMASPGGGQGGKTRVRRRVSKKTFSFAALQAVFDCRQ
jgi:hypothetical protein